MILLYLEWAFLKNKNYLMKNQLEQIIFEKQSLEDWQSKEQYEKLVNCINELINTNFQALIQLLYRLDISEKKLKESLHQHGGINAAAIISTMIIERQAEKIISKGNNAMKDSIDDEERW